MKWDICTKLHAMNGFGYADNDKGEKYSRSYTVNAECYANKCRRKGICLRRVNNDMSHINSKTQLEAKK